MPAIIAPKVLGILIFIMSIYVTDDLSRPVRHCSISVILSLTLPSIILRSEAVISRIIRKIMVLVFFFLFIMCCLLQLLLLLLLLLL